MKRTFLFALLFLLLLPGCGSKDVPAISETPPTEHLEISQDITKEALPMETPNLTLIDPQDTDLVRVRDYIPNIVEDLKYATADNFTGSVIYNFQDIYLRYGTVKKLMAVQSELNAMGLGIKIWDGFRPVSAQFKLWEICPDDTYVANPNKGYSNHSRGFAVDLTLVDETGAELEMPTAFDDFSGKADRYYNDVSPTGKTNSELLEKIMETHGFKGYYGEWWHYNDSDRYEVEHVFDPGLISVWSVSAEGSSPLLTQPDSSASIQSQIPEKDLVTILGFTGNYAYVSWNGVRGYVLCMDLKPA